MTVTDARIVINVNDEQPEKNNLSIEFTNLEIVIDDSEEHSEKQ
jgi:hypothetical protein